MTGKEFKIVVAGAMGAGKTTAITTMSDCPPILTDVAATGPDALRKEETTVAFDYGEIRLGGGEVVRLYGTPGQERFSFMWRILMQGALGVILLLDNRSPDPLGESMPFLEMIRSLPASLPVVVGVNRLDAAPELSIAFYQQFFTEQGLVYPVLEVDALCRQHMLNAFQLIFAMLEARHGISAGTRA